MKNKGIMREIVIEFPVNIEITSIGIEQIETSIVKSGIYLSGLWSIIWH